MENKGKTPSNAKIDEGVITVKVDSVVLPPTYKILVNGAISGDSGSEPIVALSDKSQASTSGNESHSVALGWFSKATTEGKSSNSATLSDKSQASTSGNESHSVALGWFSKATTEGKSSNSATFGYKSQATTKGEYSNSSTYGPYSQASTKGKSSDSVAYGWMSQAITEGECSNSVTLGWNSSSQVSGERSIACALGFKSRVAADEEGFIMLADWQSDVKGNYYIDNVYSAKVGKKIKGIKIEANTWYWFEGGELMSESIENI